VLVVTRGIVLNRTQHYSNGKFSSGPLSEEKGLLYTSSMMLIRVHYCQKNWSFSISRKSYVLLQRQMFTSVWSEYCTTVCNKNIFSLRFIEVWRQCS